MTVSPKLAGDRDRVLFAKHKHPSRECNSLELKIREKTRGRQKQNNQIQFMKTDPGLGDTERQTDNRMPQKPLVVYLITPWL